MRFARRRIEDSSLDVGPRLTLNLGTCTWRWNLPLTEGTEGAPRGLAESSRLPVEEFTRLLDAYDPGNATSADGTLPGGRLEVADVLVVDEYETLIIYRCPIDDVWTLPRAFREKTKPTVKERMLLACRLLNNFVALQGRYGLTHPAVRTESYVFTDETLAEPFLVGLGQEAQLGMYTNVEWDCDDAIYTDFLFAVVMVMVEVMEWSKVGPAEPSPNATHVEKCAWLTYKRDEAEWMTPMFNGLLGKCLMIADHAACGAEGKHGGYEEQVGCSCCELGHCDG